MSTVLIIAIVALLFDVQNVLARWTRWRLQGSDRRSDDYTIVVPVYGHRRYFEDRDHLAPFKDHVLVALDMNGVGMDELADELEAEGWDVYRLSVAVPGPPRLVLHALRSGRVKTRYAFRMDADTKPVDDPARYVAQMEDEGVDYASVRVHVMRPRKAVEKMQAIEYRMAMLSRHYRPWLSSGACFGGTVPALKQILSLHSLWFPGEDLETGRIALALKLKVRHLDLRVETEAPSTWRGLVKQRRSWWAGGFRHSVINADKNLRHTPLWTLYYLGFVVAGIFIKTSSIVNPTSTFSFVRAFLLLFVFYAILTAFANWQVRSWWMVFFPPYALVQALGMPTLGLFYWANGALRQRHFGRYRFGYRRGDLTPRSRAVAAVPRSAAGS
ncbi:MAG: glycosyltransferase family 2 protein [Actinomycetota bacterium]|nr:glycosyltransferase family 2 protein [Actinomycetota bacterium]